MKVNFTLILAVCFIFSLSSLHSQVSLTLLLNGTPPFSAGESFTVTAYVSGAGVKNNDDYQIEVTCAGCGSVPITCDIINASAGGGNNVASRCTTAPITAPTGSFYGFLVTGSCINVGGGSPPTDYNACTSGSILPVELGSFSANYNNNQIELKWQTLSELNNNRFEVEHSRDGYHFQSVGTVEGAGTITEAKNYFYFHRLSISGTHYYRLKQVDTDGTFEYSNVVGVIVDNGGQLSIYPNPAKDVIYVQQDELDGTSNFQLMDALGRKLNTSMSGNAGLYEIKLPTGLPKGTYWLKVECGGKIQTLAVVKE